MGLHIDPFGENKKQEEEKKVEVPMMEQVGAHYNESVPKDNLLDEFMNEPKKPNLDNIEEMDIDDFMNITNIINNK